MLWFPLSRGFRQVLVRSRHFTALPREFPAIVADRFGGPEVLQLKHKELPPLAPGEVLVDIRAAGVNPSDTYVRLGPEGPWAAQPHLLPTPPFTPGKDGAGVVLEVQGVDGLAVGDRVYLDGSVSGTLAARAIAKHANVHPLPDTVSFAQGACIGVPCATAFHALRHRARAEPGEKVFIHGASGAVGLAAVQLAKDMGCFVVGTAGTSAGLQAVKEVGADAVLNHREAGYMVKAQEAAGSSFDIILEMAADRNLPSDLGMCARRGRVCIIGSRAEPVAVNPRAAMPLELDIRGVFLSARTAEEKAATNLALFDAMSRGALKPVVGLQLSLSEAPHAHVEVVSPSSGGALGNIVLVPTVESAA